MGEIGPHVEVASAFMARKGYPDAHPASVARVEGEFCWYFDYEMPEGDLVLEVSWTEDDGWSAQVWDFLLKPS